MADPLKIIRRLDAVTTDYAVFERDQVLTETQLNSVVEYLDDQSRLTRTQLLGIGIVGGLRPSMAQGKISVSKGVGVTSDGDLLGLAADTVFDRWLPYDESAPAYEAFYHGGKMLPLIELLASGDKREGKPLTEIADALAGKVAVAFMESYENDPDLCTGGNCDNRGRTARNTQRLLLLEREVAEKAGLHTALPTGAELARQLPRLAAVRVDLGPGTGDRVNITSAEKFAAAYRSAADKTLNTLADAITTMNKAFGRNWPAELPDPARWTAQLKDISGRMSRVTAGIQYYHAFAKDLVATWGELREALFADESVLCPPSAAFPKHLLLGALADPRQLRTGRLPAPWLAREGSERERVLHLLHRLAALIDNFALPTASARSPKIIPSRRETATLEQRAIPIYYRSNDAVRSLWNEMRRRRGETEDNPGYFWSKEPFLNDIGAHDFFRIEGHLGLRVDAAEAAIEKLVRQCNLPIAVLSILLHNTRERVMRGPKFKRNSLHSLHYLLRRDLANQLKENIAYSGRLIGDIKAAGTAVQKPASNVLNADLIKPLEAARVKLEQADTELVGTDAKPGPLSARSYQSFSAQAQTWTAQFGEAALATSRARASLGDITRSDMMSPVDTLSGSNTRVWVDWLGDILRHREDEQKDRLLFSNTISAHPGLEHFGGAVPGGTFVLVYDDSGTVIGDLMLPYWLDDNDESEQQEPELSFPDIRVRLPDDLLPVKVVKPLDLVLDDFRTTKVLPEIRLQENYSNFFRESLGSLGDVLKNVTSKPLTTGKFSTGDLLFDQMLLRVDTSRAELESMRAIRNDDRLSTESRAKVEEQIKVLEVQLADAVSATAQHFAVDAPEAVRSGADKTQIYHTIGQGIDAVADREVSVALEKNLQKTVSAAEAVDSGSAKIVANQVMINAGFRAR